MTPTAISNSIHELANIIDVCGLGFTETVDSAIVKLSTEVLHAINHAHGELLLCRATLILLPEIITELKRIPSSRESTPAQHSLESILLKFKEFTRMTGELEKRFLRGELKTREDIPWIEYFIQYSPLFADPSKDLIANIIQNLSTETAYDVFVALIKYRRDLFLTHFPFIFATLTTPCEGERSERINKTQFFEASDCEDIKIHLQKTSPSIWKEFYEFLRPELEKKNAELWECVGRENHPEGKRYTFILRPEYNSFSALFLKMGEIYPATEPVEEEILYYIKSPSNFYNTFLPLLGYSFRLEGEVITITIPDREFLLYKYNQIKNKCNLPNLKITSSDGIASDTDFVLALVKHDGLLSEGKEFIHDHFAHILPLLKTASMGIEEYEYVKIKKTDWFQRYILKINRIKQELGGKNSTIFSGEELKALRDNLPILETLLGALVDTVSSQEFTYGNLNRPFATFEDILSSYAWVSYFKKRYKSGVLPTGESVPQFDEKTIINLLRCISRL